MPPVLLIALDSVGIDPLGHHRPDSVYAKSRFLFPPQPIRDGRPLPIVDATLPGALGGTNPTSCARAAQFAHIRLLTWGCVRQEKALTGTLTHELEARFNWGAVGL